MTARTTIIDLSHYYLTTLLTLLLIISGAVESVAEDYTISTTTGCVKNSSGATTGSLFRYWYSNNTSPLITIDCGVNNIAVSGNNLNIYPGSGSNVSISVSDGYLITGIQFDYASSGSTISYDSQTIVAANASGSWSKQDFNSNQVTFHFAGTNQGTVLSSFVVTVRSLEDGFDMMYNGPLVGTGGAGRKINSITLNRQTVEVGEDGSYFDKTSQEFLVNEGETLTAGFAWNGGWMHGYIYIDIDDNGSFKPYGINANGTPADGSNLVAYSAYTPTGNDADYKNSAGISSGNNPGLNPPSFTAPSYGIYRMRYKTDWNSLVPCGGSGFKSGSGVAIDVTLKVRKRYSLVIVNPRDKMTITIDGSERAVYNAEGDVFSTNYALTPSDISATGAMSVAVEGTTITVTYKELRWETITSLGQITDPDGLYIADGSVEYIDASHQVAEFRGIFDANHKKVRNISRALFANLNDGTVKNLTIEGASISGTTVGAIANVATGNSRVYNCGVLSGTVSGSTEAGSIVGRIEGNARVVNCYSYADVSGGTVAGIVGYNNGTSATKETVFNGTGTLVMNCAHFGKLSGTTVYPVFGGNDINNVSGINTYNFYVYDAAVTYASPNSAQGTEETSFFNRFDFYRSILNSHKALAAMYIYGTQDITDAQRDDIAHWTYDSSVAQYLSQEPWPTNTRSTLDRIIPSTPEAYKGKKVGTVSATFIINGTNKVVELPLTDMNLDTWDYTYGKVVLPFANEFEGWSLPASGSTAYDNIITGWKVTSITGGTAGTYSNYNLCDPDCTNKDLYANNNYVWAQGGNFVVPKGVTAITFTAHVGRAVYLRDTHPDIAYSANYNTRNDLGTAITGTYNGKTVYNSMADAFAQLEARSNPADQAIVLVGNYHLNKEFAASTGTTAYADKAVTFMSIDADNNQEPDYCLYQFNTQGSGRVSMPPVRFDFLALPGFGMASYTKGGYIAEMGIIHSKGWLETTETATLQMTEFEMRPQYFSKSSPVILNGGVFSKIIMTSNHEYNAETNNLLYTKIGGKAYVNSLNLGRASDIAVGTTLALHPLNVSGGEIVNCHLTGAVHNGTTSGNAYFWCNGGYIHEFNGAYQERLNGDMIAQMDHALIDEFYGGGADDAYNDAQITGDINITCNNSYVKFFCGGPKFGNMASGKTVTVNATGSTFDEYYGASYGGTAITTGTAQSGGVNFSNGDISFELPWTNYTTKRLTQQSLGIGVDFDIDFFQYAGGGKNSGNQSFYVKYASLSLAQTGNVTSTMTNCTFNGDFFGGGCRGKVAGDVTSVLNSCTVNGNAYGGGFTPTATECMVYPATPQPTYPVYKGLYGLFTKYVRTAEPEAYHWAQADGSHAAGSVDTEEKLLYTSVDMTQMGTVTGNTTLTIDGASVVKGDVYGGGAESKVTGNATVTINNGRFGADIFGGGKGVLNDDGTVKASADIGGNTTVNINGGEFSVVKNTDDATKDIMPFMQRHNIYGGGDMACKIGTLDNGNLVANTGNTNLNIAKGMFSNNSDGTGQFLNTGYGMDEVYMKEGKMFFCVFGGGYGKHTSVWGDTNVSFNVVFDGCQDVGLTGPTGDMIDHQTVLDVVGGGFNGSVSGDTHVNVGGNAMCRNIYGGGLYATIGGSTNVDVTGGNIDNIYGGNDVCGVISGNTYVLVRGGIIFGNIYGAGNGNYLYQVDPAVNDIVATWSNELNKNIYHVPVPDAFASVNPLTASDKLTIINNTRPSVTKAIIDLRGNESAYLYINGSAYVGGNSSTVTSTTDPVDLKIGKYVVLNNLFLGSNGENLKAYDYVSSLERLNDMQLNTNALLDQYMNGAVAVGNLSPTWAERFSLATNYYETYIGNLCLGGNAGSMLADKTLSLVIPETVTMFGNFIAGSKDAVFKYRDAEHRGGMTAPMAAGYYDQPKLELHIRNKWKAKKLDFMPANVATHYLVDNLTSDEQAYAEGCNVYGGCYQSGTMIGSIKMYIESDMLEYHNNLAAFEGSESAAKLRKSNVRNITVANIYGAGYGPESRNYGNVDIILKDIPGSSNHPSINNIYGGGRNGVLCGHANVRINDGLVYGDVVGGCFAANLYGSTNITVGYPKYYVCKQSGKYTLQRGDTWNATLLDKDGTTKVLKDEIRYLKGDRVPQNIYDQITGFCALGNEAGVATDIKATLTSKKEQNSDYFTFVNESNTSDPTVGNLFPQNGWTNVDINILGGVYGGGYSLNNSTAATAGSYTVRKMTADTPGGPDGFNHDKDQSLGLTPEQTTVGYGGNSSVIVADNTSGNANHIKISQNGSGGIYGDGHLVFCEGFRAADITGYGYGASTVSSPLLLNTFQRFDLLDINDCCLLLDGAQDFAADQTDATVYSLARINELRMNSSISASANLAATTTAKARNYMGFNKNVHLLGALITNDAFDTALRHDMAGAVQSDTYKTNKSTIIAGNYPADTDDKLAAFKQRNLGTARNMVGLNSGYALRIQNLHYVGGAAEKYYGPVMGVCEVKLLTLQEGEGGGYVYAKNMHADADNFLQTSGNFVFPSITNHDKVQYVVDDCYPKSFSGNSSDAEAHYWYVEGDKYYFNTTLTGYTFKKAAGADKQAFKLTTNDNNVLLAGVEAGKKLRIKSVTWNTTSYPAGYKTDLKDISSTGYTPTSVSSEPPYSFSIKVGDVWSNGMNRTDMAQQTASAYTNGDNVLPIFDVELQDNVNNEGEEYYNAHLAQPEKVTVVLEALEGSDVVSTYTVNMDIAYVLGPSYTGYVNIGNCALPGERIAFGSDGITVTTSDQMPITGTGWKLCPPGVTSGTWDVESASAIDIPHSQYDSDLSGGSTTGWVRALQEYQGWNIAYTFTAGGHPFTVWPSQSLTDAGGNTIPDYAKHLVVHNYYDMKYVNDVRDNDALALSPQADARIYIKDKAGWDAFISYLNAATASYTDAHGTHDGNPYSIPVGMAGMKLYLQGDITLDAAPSITQPFAGELNGDGYTIVFNGSTVASLFPSGMLADEAKVYNLGVVNANSIKANGNALVENCFTAADTPDFLYGRKAYELSHYYSKDDAADGEKPYINGNRFAKGEEIDTEVYAPGDWQYARHTAADNRMIRTAATPNYGSTMTAHDMSHTPALIEAHDCLFFGQTLAPASPSASPGSASPGSGSSGSGSPVSGPGCFAARFPQHLDDTKAAGTWLEANRVYETEGYYSSNTPASFYYNKAAWALQPGLTAVRFDNTQPSGDHRKPTSFGVAEGEEGYENHVTRNLLVYEADDAVKATGSANFFHVTGSKGALPPSATATAYTCADLALVDKEDFNAPYAFTATKASYERIPAYFAKQQGTAWEGICIPFAPTATSLSNGIVRHQDTVGSAMIYALNNEGEHALRPVVEGETQRDITFFWGEPTEAMLADPKTNDRTLNHEYWLRSLVSVTAPATVPDASPSGTTATFQRPGSYAFAANTPYVVSFPGETYREFDMRGQTVTFSADNAAIGVTDDATASTTVDGYSYIGTFLHKTGEYGINDDGTAFIAEQTIVPFRTYIQENTPEQLYPNSADPLQQLAKRIIYIGNAVNSEQLTVNNGQLSDNNGQLTDNDAVATDYLIIRTITKGIVVESSHDRILPCHGISGTTLGIWQIHKGINTFSNLRPGIYLIAGKKLVVR